jgi:hypothetical protein
MPVYQVEEYYLIMNGLNITEDQKSEIESKLEDEGFSNYEFQDDDTTLVVDDLTSESEGNTLEDEIRELL